jgi:hypothetical protein
MFQVKVVDKIKTRSFWSVTFFFRKSYHLWHYIEKYYRVGQATDDNVAHAHCMLYTQGYKYTHRLCNTNCFPLQQWLHERASVVRYTYFACLLPIW